MGKLKKFCIEFCSPIEVFIFWSVSRYGSHSLPTGIWYFIIPLFCVILCLLSQTTDIHTHTHRTFCHRRIVNLFYTLLQFVKECFTIVFFIIILTIVIKLCSQFQLNKLPKNFKPLCIAQEKNSFYSSYRITCTCCVMF